MSNIITNFEVLWQNNLKAKNAFTKFSKKDFASEEAYRKFFVERVRALVKFVKTNQILREMFVEAMPHTFTDALNIEGFELKTYFELLKKHPELARANKEALFNLLVSLNTQDPERFGMKEFPCLSEFE